MSVVDGDLMKDKVIDELPSLKYKMSSMGSIEILGTPDHGKPQGNPDPGKTLGDPDHGKTQGSPDHGNTQGSPDDREPLGDTEKTGLLDHYDVLAVGKTEILVDGRYMVDLQKASFSWFPGSSSDVTLNDVNLNIHQGKNI